MFYIIKPDSKKNLAPATKNVANFSLFIKRLFASTRSGKFLKSYLIAMVGHKRFH